jgi:outer membrane protein assembly factor BamB
VVYLGAVGPLPYNPYLYAIDAASGKQKWVFQMSGLLCSPPTVSNGVIYLGAQGGYFYAINTASGKQKWVFQMSLSATSFYPPIVMNNVVYISTDYDIYAIDAISGKQKWVFHTTLLPSSPVVVDGIIYVRTGYDIYAIDGISGQRKWNLAISSPLTVVDGVVYLRPDDGLLYAVDAISGQQKWTFRTNISSGETSSYWPTVINGVVYIGSDDPSMDPLTYERYNFNAYLYAIDAISGKQKWAFQMKNRVSSSPTVVSNVVYVGTDAGGILYAIEIPEK